MSVCLSIHVACLSISVPFHLSPVCVCLCLSPSGPLSLCVVESCCVSFVYNISYTRMVMICLIIFEKKLELHSEHVLAAGMSLKGSVKSPGSHLNNAWCVMSRIIGNI